METHSCISKCRRSRSGRPRWGCRMLLLMPTTPSYLVPVPWVPLHRSHQVQLYRRRSIGAGGGSRMPVDPQSLGLARTRTSAAAAGAGTELRSSAWEWSSTAFRRLCKTPNFFRTYSFGYMDMHHHSAIFYLWAAWLAFSFVPFVSLVSSFA